MHHKNIFFAFLFAYFSELLYFCTENQPNNLSWINHPPRLTISTIITIKINNNLINKRKPKSFCMKRLFFLLIVAVASVLPQSVWASSYTTNDGTLTVNSDAAGYLADLTKTAEMKACTKIVLIGKFNASDLESIQAANSTDFQATEVDMEKAQFVISSSAGTPSQANYKLFNDIPANYGASEVVSLGTQGDRAIFGGTLYKSVQGLQWNGTGTPAEQSTVYSIVSTSDFTGRSIGDYGKIAKKPDYYLQMSVTPARMDGPYAQQSGQTIGSASGNEENVIHIPGNPDEGGVLNLILEDTSRPYGYMFGVRRYYYCDGTSWKRSTEEVYNNTIAENRIEDQTGVNLTALESQEGDATAIDGHTGWAMSVVVYYVKTAEVREWQTGSPTSEQMAAATSASFDYDYRENHKSEFNNGTWVKMTDYDYYLLQGTGSWTWQKTTYTDGQVYYITKKYPSGTIMSTTQDGLPSADNQYAVLMSKTVNETTTTAQEKYHNENSWVDPSTVSETPHYVDMRFDYWKTTLQRATTSKYANEDINPEIFKDCTALTYVDFKAGVVKGFGDHKTAAGYTSPFTIKIGKDVTKIENAAFRRCDVLTTVEWDTYTDAEKQEDSGYPKELIIENEAFLQAKNLMSIKIPNRVTYIGNNAFEEVGTGTTTDINSVVVNDDPNTEPTFRLIFERRHESDTDQGSVAINCDMPLTLGSKAFFNCWYLKELSLPIRLKQMGDDCFKNSLSLTTLTMREETNSDYTGEKLRTIPTGAFEYSGVHEVTIPKSVTKIVNKAFGSTTGLTKVTFQDNIEDPVKNLIIESGAFSGGREEGRPQLDIYVMVDPSHRKMICEYAAFNYTQTVGQTSTLQNFATLHFPEEYWDYYQGNWKRGLAFRQDNLNAFKDGYRDDVKGYDGKSGGSITTEGANAGKYVHATEGKQYTPANGWQEFARTSTTIDIVIPNTGSFLRTYSTKTPKAIPLYAEVDTEQGVSQGDPFFKVYRISHFNDKYSGGSTATTSAVPEATATEVKLYYNSSARTHEYENTYIPASTGLLMVGIGNGSVSYVVYMNDVTSGASTTYPFTETQYEELSDDVTNGTNLLFPSCEDDDKTTQGTENGVPYVYLNPTYPYPYNTSTNPLQLRFFGLGNRTVDGNKEYYFGRFAPGGKATRDKAYLRLTNEVFHWRDGSIGSQKVDPNANPSAVNPSRVALNFFDDEEESGTTGIKQVDTTAQRMDSNVFYTLEGVRLNSRPTQRGIYIHNGRKVVIK